MPETPKNQMQDGFAGAPSTPPSRSLSMVLNGFPNNAPSTPPSTPEQPNTSWEEAITIFKSLQKLTDEIAEQATPLTRYNIYADALVPVQVESAMFEKGFSIWSDDFVGKHWNQPLEEYLKDLGNKVEAFGTLCETFNKAVPDIRRMERFLLAENAKEKGRTFLKKEDPFFEKSPGELKAEELVKELKDAIEEKKARDLEG